VEKKEKKMAVPSTGLLVGPGEVRIKVLSEQEQEEDQEEALHLMGRKVTILVGIMSQHPILFFSKNLNLGKFLY